MKKYILLMATLVCLAFSFSSCTRTVYVEKRGHHHSRHHEDHPGIKVEINK